MQGVTHPSKGLSKSVKTFRNALGFDSFGAAGGNGKKSPTQQPIDPPANSISQPTTQPVAQIVD